jgi:hypothetical protein
MSRATTVETSPPDAVPGRRSLRPAVLDGLVVAVWFAVAGFLGALVWWLVTPLPTVTKVGDAVTLTAEALVTQVGIDGWFAVVATAGGLLSGVLLLAWRGRDPVLMVVLVVLGGALASWLMVRIGLLLGPGEESAALRGMPDGSEVSMQLKLHAWGVAWIWPIAATLGALGYLWIGPKPSEEADGPSD